MARSEDDVKRDLDILDALWRLERDEKQRAAAESRRQHEIQRETPIPDDVGASIGRLMVEMYLGETLIREAVDTAFAASARTHTLPTRRSLRTIATAWLAQRVNREIDRRIRLLLRDLARRAA